MRLREVRLELLQVQALANLVQNMLPQPPNVHFRIDITQIFHEKSNDSCALRRYYLELNCKRKEK